MNGEDRIEKMREMDALGLGHEPEQRAIAVETPRPPFLDDLQIGLAVAVQQLVADPAGRVLVGEFDRVGSEPLDADDSDDARRQDAADGAIRFDIFEAGQRHARSTMPRRTGRLVFPPSSNARPSPQVLR